MGEATYSPSTGGNSNFEELLQLLSERDNLIECQAKEIQTLKEEFKCVKEERDGLLGKITLINLSTNSYTR